MDIFQEICHSNKEEFINLFFHKSESESIRMLGLFVGRKSDMQEGLKRARQGVRKVKKKKKRLY